MESASNNFAPESDSARAIQIIYPENHEFKVNMNSFNHILNMKDMEDRHVVVVSIVGVFRKGKSFLLNFFLKYLNAQYKKHDVSDWLDENENGCEISGFKWRGGREPETTGIWMWSEIFTHDYSDGKKVAIILMDTQGIFDHKSSRRDCTTTFALSMLLSSVQCYNVMQNIQKDDLENLEMFTEYGRLVLEQTQERPFQKLHFIIRDWPYAFETGYGWDGQQVINEILNEDDSQTSENQQLRDHIKSSFGEIKAFLMPPPGKAVAQLAENDTVQLQQIDSEFIKYVKELVPAIFAPENLIVKMIKGQELRAHDWIKCVEKYTGIFNGNTLPEPKTIFMATAEVDYLILQQTCSKIYRDFMQKSLDAANKYLDESELAKHHKNALDKAIAWFLEKQKFGGDVLVDKFKTDTINAIEESFISFKRENNGKKQFMTSKIIGYVAAIGGPIATFGAACGAAIGMIIGPEGAAIGSIIGGTIGGIVGVTTGWIAGLIKR